MRLAHKFILWTADEITKEGDHPTPGLIGIAYRSLILISFSIALFLVMIYGYQVEPKGF